MLCILFLRGIEIKYKLKLLYPYFSELYLEHVNLNLLINITNKISYALFEFCNETIYENALFVCKLN